MRYISLLLLTLVFNMHSMQLFKRVMPVVNGARFASNINSQGPLFDTHDCHMVALPAKWDPVDQKEFEEAVLAKQFALAEDKLKNGGAFLFHKVDLFNQHTFGPDILQRAIDSLNPEAVKWLINEQYFMKDNMREKYVGSLLTILQKLHKEYSSRFDGGNDSELATSNLEKATDIFSMVVHAEYGCYSIKKRGRPMSEEEKEKTNSLNKK